MGGGRKELGGRDGGERREGKLWQGCKKYKIKQQKPKQSQNQTKNALKYIFKVDNICTFLHI